MSDKLLKKIAHLFTLAGNNSSPEEAQAALEMARRLLQEHNLTMIDVENVEEHNGVVAGYSETTTVGKKVPQWKKSLSVIVAEYLDVKVVIRKYMSQKNSSFLFYGLILNTEVAIGIFLSLLKQIAEMVKVYRGKGHYAKDEYRNGILTGLDKRLIILKIQQNSKCTALTICSDKVADRWMEKEGYKVKKSRGKTRKEQAKEQQRKEDNLGWDRQFHFSRGVNDSHGLVLEQNALEGDSEPKKPATEDPIVDILGRLDLF